MGFLPEHGPRPVPVKVLGDTGNNLHKFVVSIPRVLVAEEEGFDFVEHETGTCWHALVVAIGILIPRDLRSPRINTAFT